MRYSSNRSGARGAADRVPAAPTRRTERRHAGNGARDVASADRDAAMARLVAAAEAARSVGLHYRFDDSPGIRRQRRGQHFVYVGSDGKRITDATEIARIKRLAVPPAWEQVWISPDPRAHLLATGRDQRGRKQFRYHPTWRAVRDADKYERLIAFAEALPTIRAAVERDLGRPGLPREKVLAAIVKLLEASLIRVGNDEYARANRSFGLTTLRERHVEISGFTVTFEFRGKGGKQHQIKVADRRLARIVKNCRDLPGYELFQYLDEAGARRRVVSDDVNAYLREIAGDDFSAKDFRTWHGTVLAALTLQELAFDSETAAKRAVTQAIECVAARLGNTPAICRKCYVHPAVIDAFRERTLLEASRRRPGAADASDALSADEQAVLQLLRDHASRAPRPTKPGELTETLRRAVTGG
jgi:DNA topoisomerase-1